MLPVGGATSLSSWLHLRLTNFNSRSPRGERQESTQIRYFHPYFNPRSPRGERLGARSSVSAPSLFQSTLSVGRATTSCRRPCASCGNFNPRSPRGERPSWNLPDGRLQKFQSTLSEGRATGYRRLAEYLNKISIHALRGESDSKIPFIASEKPYFNPRSPRGERGLKSLQIRA